VAKQFPLAKPFIIKLPNGRARNLRPKLEAKRLLAARERELDERAAAFDQTVSDRLAAERANLSREIEARLRSGLSTEIADLKRQADERSERLAQAQIVELELRTEKRDLEERENLTFVTGAPSLPVATKPHAFAATHSFHSRTVVGYLPIANGLIVTW
jgi:hypothetical protein